VVIRQEASLPGREVAGLRRAALLDAHAMQGLVVCDRRDDDLPVVFEPDEPAVE